nr:hypothetical protein BaRGS_025225 [Batillaria attramentaria]
MESSSTETPFSNQGFDNSTVGLTNETHNNNNAADVYDDYYWYPEMYEEFYNAGVRLWEIAPPLIGAFGTFGNVMSIVVCSRMKSIDHFLKNGFIALAVSDLLLLYFSLLLTRWVSTIAGGMAYNPKMLNAFTCKLHAFVVYSTNMLSAWLVVAMTFRRAASVIWPHRAGVAFTKRKSQIVLAALVSVVLLINAHFLFGYTKTHEAGVEILDECVFVSNEYGVFVNNVWNWVDLFASSFVPFGLLVVSNAVLVWKVLASVRAARGRLATGGTEAIAAREKRASSMTVTLICVSISFITLTGPVALWPFVDPYGLNNIPEDFYHFLVMQLVWSACLLLWTCNTSINFYLYCLTGTKFREEFRRIFTSPCCSRQGVSAARRKRAEGQRGAAPDVVEAAGHERAAPEEVVAKSANPELDF